MKTITEGKTRKQSITTMTELVLPNDANIVGNLLGGRMLHFIDISGAMAATRHCDGLVATKTIDLVEFTKPVKVGNIVELKSYVTWSGNTSLEVAVEVYYECDRNERHFLNKVYLVFVGIDKTGKKRSIPPFIPETDEEREEFAAADVRRKNRMLK